ncbi:MAG: hypothetical protein M3O02_11255 [Acidobacteriota bacterium]|nr:hypothetical protein [Acidobacteriota bacterium]
MMRTLVLLLAIWPFHRHMSAPDAPAVATVQPFVHPDSACERSEYGFFYLGADGMVGISRESCEAAFKDWQTTGKPFVADFRA